MKFGVLSLMLLTCLSGCTIIRYVDPPPPPEPPVPPPPKVVDLLVMVELDRATSQLAPYYGQIVATLQAQLLLQNIQVRKTGMAPMYRRTGDVVPLLWGDGDTDGEFSSPADTIGFYAMDDAREYLREDDSVDGENLATLGPELASRAVYHPTTADPIAAPYFTTPADGFVVVYLTAKARVCAHDQVACQLDGVTAAEYFSRETSEKAEWLELPDDTGVPVSKIYHLAIATEEGVSEDAFYDGCERRRDFPAGATAFMEPSGNVYYEAFISELRRNGGNGSFVGMCEAISTMSGGTAMASAASDILKMF